MREYDEHTLKKLQNTVLSIYKDFAEICKNNNLKFFSISGTSIGTVRHGGFIPWDDDMDIGLLRPDYEKVLEILKRDYSDKYLVVNGDTFDGYPLMTTRIMIKGTSFVEYSLKNIKCPLGIFLDIYAFDNVAPDEKAANKQAKKAWLYSKLLILKHIPFPVIPFRGIKLKLCHFVTLMAYLALNIFFVSHKYLYNKAYNVATMYNDIETEECDYFFARKMGIVRAKKDDIFPTVEFDFEDTKIQLPKEYDAALTREFGDYMKLPPEEKRKNHFPYKLDFGDNEKYEG